jgi:hypothetical protein
VSLGFRSYFIEKCGNERKCNNEARPRNHSCRGKAYSEWVSVALVTQHAKCIRRSTLSTVACPALPDFSTLSHIWHDFRENLIKHKMCALIFSINLSQTFLIRRRIHPDIFKNVRKSSCEILVIIIIIIIIINRF